MNRLRKVVILLDLVEGLRENESWCGETHIQKAVYFLQTIFNVPLDYGFVLYKYGPFSFDLSDELVKIRADGLLKSFPTPPFGVTFNLGEHSDSFRAKFAKTKEEFRSVITTLTAEIGPKGVKELERLATIQYITLENAECDPVKRLIELKPHISREEGEEALQTLNSMKRRLMGQGS